MPVSRKSIPAQLPDPEELSASQVLRAYESGEYDLVCVLGPTASGKTRYAVRLARELQALMNAPSPACAVDASPAPNGAPSPSRAANVPDFSVSAAASTLTGVEILSADSRQVYRGMDIGTGKDLGEYGEVPYHLIDIAEAGEKYNVYRFQNDFAAAYADIRSRGALPLLCGGTGLYISAVTGGYDFVDNKPLSARRADAVPSDAALPPAAPESPAAGLRLPSRTFFIGTLVSREERNAGIDARLDARLKEGMVEEIRGLLERGVDPDALIAYGLEYKFVTLYLQGRLTYDQMRTQLATAIHQFAKRQMTWFRGMERSGITIHWVRP